MIETLRSDMMNDLPQTDADAIHSNETQLEIWVGFMDGNKIQIHRPSGSAVLQRTDKYGN